MKRHDSLFKVFGILICMLGFGLSAFAWDAVPGKYYYDNSTSQWTGKMWMYFGKSDAGRENAMTGVVAGTDIVYYERMASSNTWSGAAVAYFLNSEVTPSRISTGLADIATYVASLAGASSVIDHCSVGQMLCADGSYKLMDVFLTFNGGQTGIYNEMTKVSDTQWEWTGAYGGDSFFAVSTNNPTLGTGAKGVGVYEVQIVPTLSGSFEIGDQVKIIYTTATVVDKPSSADVVTISSVTSILPNREAVNKPVIIDNGNGVSVKVSGSAQVKVCSIQGTLISEAQVEGSFDYPLNTGIYIINVNGNSYKFVKK